MSDENRLYTIGGSETEAEREPDYKRMYFALYNGVSDIIEQLQTLQQRLEDMYIDGDKP